MESKILKGDAAGGLAEITRKKEEELKRKEQELERRCAPQQGLHACVLLVCLLCSRTSRVRRWQKQAATAFRTSA